MNNVVMAFFNLLLFEQNSIANDFVIQSRKTNLIRILIFQSSDSWTDPKHLYTFMKVKY